MVLRVYIDNHFVLLSTHNYLKMQSDRDAKIKEFMPVVIKIAKLFARKMPPNFDMDDLTQIGVIGLITAIDKYEEVAGIPFEAYAKIRIKGEIVDELRRSDTLRRVDRAKVLAVNRATKALEGRLLRKPLAGEVRAELKFSSDEFYKIVGTQNHVSAWREENDAFCAGALRDDYWLSEPEEILIKKEALLAAINLINASDRRKSKMMQMLYGDFCTLKQIGDELGVSESWVSQIHKRVLSRLEEFSTLQGDNHV